MDAGPFAGARSGHISNSSIILRAHRVYGQRLHGSGPHVFDVQRRKSRAARNLARFVWHCGELSGSSCSPGPRDGPGDSCRLHSKQLLTAGEAFLWMWAGIPNGSRIRAPSAALREVDIFFPNEREGAVITGETEPDRMLRAFERDGPEAGCFETWRDRAQRCSGTAKFCFRSQERSRLWTRLVRATALMQGFSMRGCAAWIPERVSGLARRAARCRQELLGGIAGFPAKEELELILCTAK